MITLEGETCLCKHTQLLWAEGYAQNLRVRRSPAAEPRRKAQPQSPAAVAAGCLRPRPLAHRARSPPHPQPFRCPPPKCAPAVEGDDKPDTEPAAAAAAGEQQHRWRQRRNALQPEAGAPLLQTMSSDNASPTVTHRAASEARNRNALAMSWGTMGTPLAQEVAARAAATSAGHTRRAELVGQAGSRRRATGGQERQAGKQARAPQQRGPPTCRGFLGVAHQHCTHHGGGHVACRL